MANPILKIALNPQGAQSAAPTGSRNWILSE